MKTQTNQYTKNLGVSKCSYKKRSGGGLEPSTTKPGGDVRVCLTPALPIALHRLVEERKFNNVN